MKRGTQFIWNKQPKQLCHVYQSRPYDSYSLGTDTYERSIGASLTTLPFLSLIPKFIGLYGIDPATILNLKINDFSILQSYGYINILCHIFNSARNNQQQPVMFIYVMVSAGVCFGGKGRLHLIPDKTKVNAKLYVETLFPELVQNCRSVLPSGFIFQHDGAPAHTAKLAQDWIATNCSEFIGKDEWPPNSPGLNSGQPCLGSHA